MEEKELIVLFRERDESAVEKARERYGAYCMSIALNILGNEKEAEECVSEAMLGAWNSIPQYMPERVSTYLGRLTRNAAINRRERLRAQKRGGGEPMNELSELVSDRAGPEDLVINKELLGAVNDFLGTLPKQKRDLFVLRYWYFESIERLSERFGISPNAIAVKLHRLRKSLKKYLEERDFII